ncbi:hypothetical protein SynA1825c_00094 [Synechococcus sp. A18-25c]|uniref:hypothetical protein n=1 Tax=Synechococcus sp. A18-25c TaxID=1866938 RepID=UPI0016469658|nr:hypothetical protein [Synechococcus sp. A18-25c]QNJ18437.1 hypothetical protein SynA1825c_00094 [Synechococcus sp. A18-25c]
MTLRLQLHVGHGKTGSSYLQSWLAANAAVLLNQHQLLYPQICPFTRVRDRRAEQSQFSMGNGFVLNPVLQDGVSWRRQQRWWRRLCQQQFLQPQQLTSLVFSHEPWARQLPSQWPQLMQLVALMEVQALDCWLLVRDPLDHALSVYGQMVKRHGFSGSVEDWLGIYDFPEVLMRFLDAVEASSHAVCLRVDHYGSRRQELLRCLKQWLVLPADGDWTAISDDRVNRSLTAAELTLMRWLNARDPDLALRTGEHLIQRLPQLRGAVQPPSVPVIERFLQRWQGTVDRLNQRLPSHAQLRLPRPETGGLPGDDAFADPALTLTREQLDCLLDAAQGVR